MSDLTRRTTLKALAAAGVAPLLPGCERDPGAPDGAEPRPLDWETLRRRIDTVVVVVMENRSFDHYLGALSLEGRADVDGLTVDMSNPHPAGHEVVVHPATDACAEDPPHSWRAGHAQLDGGTNRGFVREMHARAPADADLVMGYWDRRKLPIAYALADAHVVCDRWFCALPSSTWPNRFYLWCGENGGVRGNDQPSAPLTSIFHRLTAAGRTHADYFQNAPFNALLPDGGSTEFRRWEAFLEDAAAGILPNLTVLNPIYGRNDDHPPNHPLAGQVFLAEVYDTLARSPQWERTLLLITYDEHGGFFDHVVPPKGVDDRAAEGFDQRGFRVPTLVAGPWVRRGEAVGTPYDHTSLLAFLSALYEVEPLNARVAAADPMLDVFDPEAVASGVPHPPTELPVVEASDEELYAPECLYSFFAAPPPPTMQPELEAEFDARFRGGPLDRRHETLALYQAALKRAERRGLLRRG